MSKWLNETYLKLKSDAEVLDVGCWGFRQVEIATSLGLTQLRHAGIDYSEPDGALPKGFTFKKVDLNKETFPFEDDRFDLVVMSHVIEHIANPIDFFGECVRVCKPGGYIYVEAPSERSLWLPGMPFEHEKFYSSSYYDDPTHQSRPWTPQSLYRLAKYYACEPEIADYIVFPLWYRLLFPILVLKALWKKNGGLLERYVWGAFGWASFVVAKKPESVKGKPEFRYYIPKRD